MAWRARPGSRGGPRSEAQKLGLASGRRQGRSPVTAAAVQAFLVGDDGWLREHLALAAWENTPCCAFAEPGDVKTEGDARARDFRRRVIARIERRGRFRFIDLDHEDDGRAGMAWDALGVVAEPVGMDSETWARIREAAGWEKTTEKTEQEDSNAGA